MDYIREFDIQLEKEYYYPGETVKGDVILDTIENFKLRSKYYEVLLIIKLMTTIFYLCCSTLALFTKF